MTLDHAEISILVARLARWLDEKRFGEARSVFTEDVSVATAGGTTSGIAEVTAQAARIHSTDVTTQHFITAPLIEVDGDRATVDADLLVAFVDLTGAGGSRLIGERYHLKAERANPGWRISHVGARPLWETPLKDAAIMSLASSDPK